MMTASRIPRVGPKFESLGDALGGAVTPAAQEGHTGHVGHSLGGGHVLQTGQAGFTTFFGTVLVAGGGGTQTAQDAPLEYSLLEIAGVRPPKPCNENCIGLYPTAQHLQVAS